MPYYNQALGAVCDELTRRNYMQEPPWGIRWLRVFRPPGNAITPDDMQDHKQIWKIGGDVSDDRWNRVAETVQRNVKRDPPIDNADLYQRVGILADALKASPGLNGSQISWATKILLSTWPSVQIHIWDSMVWSALGGNQMSSNSPAAKRYCVLHTAVGIKLVAERCNETFQQALAVLQKEVANLPPAHDCNPSDFQPLADPVFQKSMGNFLERRLLDKLLWFRGWARQQRRGYPAPAP